jgi:amidase
VIDATYRGRSVRCDDDAGSPIAEHEMTDTVWTDATAQAEAIRAGVVSATEVADEYLARIDCFDPELRAYVSVDRDGVLAGAARADDAVRTNGPDTCAPFLGVTISIKDVIDVDGLPTTHSSKALAHHVAAHDHPLVERLRHAGFLVLGKTNVPEFCTSMTSSELNGICRNPWDTARTPGGSSGGAAAGLAAGLCAVAHGTDGAGSVRTPASFCGLVGLKPTRGLIGFGPELGNAYYQTSVDGILARSVRDTAALLDVFVGFHDPVPAWSARPDVAWSDALGTGPGHLRVAVTTSFPFGEVSDVCGDAVHSVARQVESLGHEVVDATPAWEVILACAAGPMSVPGAVAHVGLDQLDLVEPRNRPLIEREIAYTTLEHYRWVEQTRAASREFVRFWDDVDVLLTPTAGILPPSVDWAPWDQQPDEHMATFMGFANFSQPFNLSGQPGLNVPAVWTDEGIPVGVQLVARPFEETTLFRLARQIELAMPWADRRPPGFG